MKVTFLGAAQTVTGSCYIIEGAGHRFALDCGMHQGSKVIEERNFDTEQYAPQSLEFVLLTHAHIDHSGLLPRIGAHGFNGPVYCTEPTADLVALMLEDSAHIQEMEYEWKQKQRNRKGKNKISENEVLYTMKEAKKVTKQLEVVEFDQSFEPVKNIKVTYKNAAHILGAAFIIIDVTEDGKSTRLTFSGDLGRPGALLLHDAAVPEVTDYLFVESTYGDRDHKGEDDTLEELMQAIEYSYERKGKVLIPTFAVERAQEIMHSLHLLKAQGKIPQDMPIFLDSPLAIRATDIFYKHSDKLNIQDGHANTFDVNKNNLNIHFTLSTEESQALNMMIGPAIILSASGMCNAGRIKHHLKHSIWQPETSLVFVGYQAVGTLGRKIIEGAEHISIFNEQLKVAAKIFTIGGFSAHADQSQLLDWIETIAEHKPHVIFTHGEPKAQEAIAKIVQEKFHLQTSIPSYLGTIELKAGAQPVLEAGLPYIEEPQASDNLVLQGIVSNLGQLQAQLTSVAGKSRKEQSAIYERIALLNRQLADFLSEI